MTSYEFIQRGRDQHPSAFTPDCKSTVPRLSTGSVNVPTIVCENAVYKNAPARIIDLAARMQRNGVRPEIEASDLSRLHGARRLVDAGLMDERPHAQFVMGVQNAMPAEGRLLDFLLTESRRVATPAEARAPLGLGARA